MKTLFRISALFLLASFFPLHAEEPNPPEGFRALFNGKDLTGWYGLNPHSVAKLEGEKKEAALQKMRDEFADHWRVENGELVNDGHGPYATTEEDLGDIEFLLEYKTVAGADSGIYLRGTPQVQIWDKSQVFDPEKPTRRPHMGSGGLFNNTPDAALGRDPSLVADKPFGQWNEFRIRQIGARTWVWLNKKLVVDGAVMENYWDREKPLPATGPIMLQTHGGEIRWRNIFVREIGEEEGKKILAANPPIPDPTEFDVAYGPHVKQKLHFWKAESETPTPLLFFIHGGGWMGGGRMSGLTPLLSPMLDAGISVASIEYRFIPEATADGEVPPVKGPLHDAARALQFVRSKAAEWNIDKNRIAASGGSAGACSSLWLAFHPDMAAPDSDDPVARESTRLLAAAVSGAQTTLDPKQMRDWTPNSRYGGHAFGFKNFEEFYQNRESISEWIAEYSPYALVSSDDPPVYLYYSGPPAIGEEQKDPTHTSNFGLKLQEHCEENGVDCELYYRGVDGAEHDSVLDYLLDVLAPEKNDGFQALLNGNDLSGWDGDPELWKVEDGVVVGTCNGPDHFEHNTFLIWQGGKVKDFILHASMRIDGDNNSGIQYRSRRLPENGQWAITGYQCDVHPATQHMGMTYEEKGRGIFGLNGKDILIDPDGARWQIGERDPVQADLSEWTEFTVVARGNQILHKVNGQVTSKLIDHDEEGRALEGLLAIQLHRGNPHTLQIRDLRIKVLDNVEPIAFDPEMLEEAEKIDKPRTSNPQGTGPVQKKPKG